MLVYYRARLESTYIPALRSSLKDCVHLFRDDQDDGFSTVRQGLLAFQNLIFDGNTPPPPSPGQAMTDRHSLLVIKA